MTNPPLTVLILAAGHGTRMKSATLKLLHKAAGVPLVDHVRTIAESLSPDRIAFVVAPGMEALHQRVEPHQAIIQSPAKGTGHAVQVAMSELKAVQGFILVMLGDCPLVTTDDARAVLNACQSDDTIDAAFLSAKVDLPQGLGRMILGPDGHTLLEIVEESDASDAQKKISLINGGLVALRADKLPALLARLSDGNNQGELYLTDLPKLIASDGRKAVAVETRPDHILGVNTRAQLAGVEAVLQARLRLNAMSHGVTLIDPHTVYFSMDTQYDRDVTIEPNVFISTGVKLEEGVRVRAFTHLEDVHLHKNVAVGPFARIRGGSVLEEGAAIGNFVEVKKSRLGTKTKAAHLTYIGDADVGSGTNIGAGTITCNYDGEEKHKTVIGANSFIGSHSTLVAPVNVGSGTYIAAGSVITQDVPDGALGLGRARQENKSGWVSRRKDKKGK